MSKTQAPEGGQSLAVAARELLDALAAMNTGTLPEHQMAPGWQNGAGEEIGTRICAAQAYARAALAAQPQAPVALTPEQKRAMWKASDFRGSGGQIDWYVKGIEDAERVHGITQTKEPTNG